jgi:hypothetical protein
MKDVKKTAVVGGAVLLMVVLASLAACSGGTFVDPGSGGGGGSSSGGGSNPFIGTWTGKIQGIPGYPNTKFDATVICTESEWTITWGSSSEESGTYTRSGSTATLKDGDGFTIGTATVSGNTLQVSINSSITGSFTK